jgi:multimeric flavodoxin WrbA
MMPRQDEVIIISKLTFGGLSPDVKAVLDRSIGYMLPSYGLAVTREEQRAKKIRVI